MREDEREAVREADVMEREEVRVGKGRKGKVQYNSKITQ